MLDYQKALKALRNKIKNRQKITKISTRYTDEEKETIYDILGWVSYEIDNIKSEFQATDDCVIPDLNYDIHEDPYEIEYSDIRIPDEDTTLDPQEKIYLIELLLKDIRGDWGTNPVPRAMLAEKLCKEIGTDDFLKLSKVCHEYILMNQEDDNCIDGRYFREDFPNGYIDMGGFYDGKLSYNYNDKSEEFKHYVDNFIVHPHFSDYERNMPML
jgi:hypothetical protein